MGGCLERLFLTFAVTFTHDVIFILYHVTLDAPVVTAYTLGACDGNPCMNGGQCVDMGTEANPKQFTCACSEGYTGLTCQKRIDPCADEPCQNGGICEPRGEHFHCSCTERFKGKLCEQYIRKRNPCLGDPCGAHGFCEVVNYDFICQCSPGFHGSRCEYEEESEAIVEEDPVVVHVAEAEPSKASSALVIGEVVLILFCIFIFVLLMLCIHWVRVANRRSKIMTLQQMKSMAGQEIECTPGWFETSNEVCYDFFCYCCKLVSRYENENCQKMVVTETGEVKKASSANQNQIDVPKLLSRPPSRSSIQPLSQLDQGNLSRPASESKPPSISKASSAKSASRVASKPSSLPPSANATPRTSKETDYPFPADTNPNQAPYEDCVEVDLSQNRRRRGGGGRRQYARRTARGAMPGFQPGSEYMDEVDDVGPAPHKVRVRKYVPRRGRSNRAVIDIADFDEDDDDDSSDNDDGVRGYRSGPQGRRYVREDDGSMVGPSGNILPMAFRGGMHSGSGRRVESVDQLYFNNNGDSEWYDHSNSYKEQESAERSSRELRSPTRTSRNQTTRRAGQKRDRQNNFRQTKPQRNNDIGKHSDGSASEEESPDEYNNGDQYGDDNDQVDFEGSDEENNGEEDDRATDDESDVENENEFQTSHISRSSQSNRLHRRTRRSQYQQRRRAAPPEDDGYSSTGRLSESDAGGRSRDPLSVEGMTRQAQRKFYKNQSQTRVPRHELKPCTTARPPSVQRNQQLGRITFSPLPALTAGSIQTPSIRPNKGFEQTFEPYRGSSPFVAVNAGQRTYKPTAFSYPSQQHYQHQPGQYTAPDPYMQQQQRQLPQYPQQTLYNQQAMFIRQPQYPQQYSQPYQNAHPTLTQDHQAHNVYQGEPPSLSFREGSGNRQPARRPRSSFSGWNRASPKVDGLDGALRTSTPVPYHYDQPTSPVQQQHEQAHKQMYQYPSAPARKPKVKGILKKTSAFGGNTTNSALTDDLWLETSFDWSSGKFTPFDMFDPCSTSSRLCHSPLLPTPVCDQLLL